MSRPRKNVRAYRHHVVVCLTYFEAECLAQYLDGKPNFHRHSTVAATNRAKKRIAEAAALVQPEPPEREENPIQLIGGEMHCYEPAPVETVEMREKWRQDDRGNVYRWTNLTQKWELTPFKEVPFVEFEWSADG